ncbi:mechanosensitive ion channel family protein [Janibacter sp. G1551]|uniref:mechanosensitive ion channel family protein n=1 Tax=Janibacter sp. G1551 TaxID=3420440 RepID=UPI003D060DF3
MGDLTVAWDEVWHWFVGVPARIVATLVAAVVLRWFLHRSITAVVDRTVARSRRGAGPTSRAERVLARATGAAHERHRQRAQTMGSLLRSIVTVVVLGIAALTIMALLGIPLGPLLASAGVGGVALGFGAQSLVKDFLSGVFMILEDQYGVGDVIDTGEAIGTVEEVSLRVTRLRDADGVVWYVRNGEIIRIANRSQGWSTALVDVQVSSGEDVARVTEIMRAALHDMDEDPQWQDELLEEPKVLGVESIGAGTVTLRVLATCASDANFAVQREIRFRLKAAFDREGVQGPPLPPIGPVRSG